MPKTDPYQAANPYRVRPHQGNERLVALGLTGGTLTASSILSLTLGNLGAFVAEQKLNEAHRSFVSSVQNVVRPRLRLVGMPQTQRAQMKKVLIQAVAVIWRNANLASCKTEVL